MPSAFYSKCKNYLFFLITVLFLLTSFASKPVKSHKFLSVNKLKADTVIKTLEDATNASSTLDILILYRDQFDILYQSLRKEARWKYKQRVVFQFYHQSNDILTLAAYPAKRRNKRFGDSIILENVSKPTSSLINLSGQNIFLGDQQFRVRKNFMDTLLKYDSPEIIFIPEKKVENNQISYNVYVKTAMAEDENKIKSPQIFFNKAAYTPVAKTDPSPPARAK